jgi:hypothetical protein
VERDGKIAASFPQRWDRTSGEYRVSGVDKEGRHFTVVMNVYSREGKAWVDGKPVADSKEWLDRGYKRFINDTYWLLMGFKLQDPGVHLAAAGSRQEGDRIFDVVKLTFDHVGLTPGDQYWAWVNRDTGMLEKWEMLLEGSKPDEKPTVVLFHDYARHGGLLLSTRREIAGGGTTIRLDDLQVLAAPPAGAFRN